MKLFEFYFILTIPTGISFLFLFVNKKKIDEIIFKYDNNYISKFNSTSFRKIINTYKICNSIDEKKILFLSIIFYLIGLISIISWGVLTLFFPNLIRNLL
jgi:hypothetical protein